MNWILIQSFLFFWETKQEENFLLKILLCYILNILLHKNHKGILSTKREYQFNISNIFI